MAKAAAKKIGDLSRIRLWLDLYPTALELRSKIRHALTVNDESYAAEVFDLSCTALDDRATVIAAARKIGVNLWG